MYAVDQKTIRRLIAEENLKPAALAAHLGVSSKTVRSKLADADGRLWKAHELAKIADLVMVAPGSFFTYKCA